MKRLAIRFVIFLLLNLAFGQRNFASIVGIIESKQFYGLGFIVEGDIVTPAHLALTVCSLSDSSCSAVFKTKDWVCDGLRLKKFFLTFDLARLECLSKTNKRKGLRLDRDFNYRFRQGKLYYLIPKNNQLESVKGVIKEHSRLFQTVSTRVRAGNSGALGVDQQGKVVGILLRAEKVADAVLGKILPNYKHSGVMVRSRFVKALFDKRIDHARLVDDILDFYRKIVRNKFKFHRLTNSMQFTHVINSYLYDFREDPQLLKTFAGKDLRQELLILEKDSGFFPLLIAYQIEKFGLSKFDENISIENIELSSSKELIRVFKEGKFKGQLQFFVGLGILASVIASILAYSAIIVVLKSI